MKKLIVCFSLKRWSPFLLIFLPLLVSFACAPIAPAAPANIPSGLVVGSGPMNLMDTRTGLADLASYKATLTLSFDGTKDGQANQWSKTYVMLTTKEPAARQFSLDKSGDLTNPDAVFMAEMNGTDYERRGDNACSANAIEQGNSLGDQFEPAGILNFLLGADEAGSETVNDVPANHYTFDQRALGQQDVTESNGEIWVAAEGGYVVKYLLTTKAKADYFGEGIEGTITYDYELTDVNKPITIELPADCSAGMVNAPPLPDATNVVNMPGVLMYDTASSATDASAFYQEQIPALGWKLSSQPTFGDNAALLIFTQGDQTLTVVITVVDPVTKVQLVLENAKK